MQDFIEMVVSEELPNLWTYEDTLFDFASLNRGNFPLKNL
jgi:hypothetical protein